MGIIRFPKRRRNVWTRRRRGRWEKVSRAFSELLTILLLIGFSQLYQGSSLHSALDKVAIEFATQIPVPKISRSLGVKPLQGRATVIDGDTIRIKGQKIRLYGIDAPENHQTCISKTGVRIRCGVIATRYLKRYLQSGARVTCKFIDYDRYRRFVGKCRRIDGKSLAVAMVSAGHALDWPKYSGGAYARHQNRAKRNKRGIWATRFEKPWDYRRKRRSG